jgi:hypothetical protein
MRIQSKEKRLTKKPKNYTRNTRSGRSMSDLIKREDAIEALCRGCGWKESQCDQDNGFWCESGALIRRDIPSADRPQGEWIDMGDFEQCSVCKGTRLKEFQSYYGKVTWIKTPYCPSCGARMKGADDE